MKIGKLTTLEVKRLMRERKRGLSNDGGGLYLKNGSSWIFRYSGRDKKHDHGLGSALDIGLAESRELAAAARKLRREGRDPISEKRALRVASLKKKTLAEVAEAHIASQRPAWRSEKHLRQWQSSLTNYVFPVIGALDVAAIDTPDIMRVLTPIWAEKPETASRVRSRLELILDAAKAQGLRDGPNPARWKGHLQALLPSPRKIARVTHFAAMPYAEVGAFIRELKERRGTAARALEFAILTAGRSGEAIGARWDEIDLEQCLWTIPGARMKAARLHRVPLAARVVEIVVEMAAIRQNDYVFPGARRGRPLTAVALEEVLLRMGQDSTVHGFRSTFRDWAGNETTFPREVAEAALAHVVGDSTEQAYRRSDALERRRKLMDAWARFCDGPTGEHGAVLQFSRSAT
jgi:integrase